MEQSRITFWATLAVFATGTFWGLYWIPVRQIAELGLDGAWGVFAIVTAALILLAPFGWRGRAGLRAAPPLALASIALCGLAFMLYSVGLNYGRVAIVVILFFLTPVWSTLLGRYLIGWTVTVRRLLVLLLGIAGLLMMLGAGGTLPLPRNLGEWLGLLSGFLWALATVGIRVKATTGPFSSAFVLVAGAWIGALIVAPLLEPVPQISGLIRPWAILGWVMVAALCGVAAAMVAVMWAATKLDPARIGVLLMAEVFVSAISAALIAGETLSAVELLGGGLVLIAGLIEVWPARRRIPAK